MQEKTAILLINLGTPDSPSPKDVKRYLIEFLTDKRVIDIPWVFRQMLVRFRIVPFRYKSSAKAYKSIWQQQGSPLLYYGQKVKKALQKRFDSNYIVELAMRYGNPSIEDVIKKLTINPIEKLIILPLFPQYASATTGSVQQKVMEICKDLPVIPKITFIDHFFSNEAVIDSFCAVANKDHIQTCDHVIFSFHGLPKRHLEKIDQYKHCFTTNECCYNLTSKNRTCYSAQCHYMAQNIASKLAIPKDKYTITFQSRLGKEPWLEPSTSDVITKLATAGHKKLVVFSPSFVCDCLETLYEIGIEYKEEFILKGGKELVLIEGLNDHPKWIEALQSIVTCES